MTNVQKPVQIQQLAQCVLSMIENGVKWPEIKMETIAQELNIDTAVLKASFENKKDIFAALFIYIDQQTEHEADSDIVCETPRDRLFEIMMARFDVLNAHADAWRHLFYETFKDPDLFRLALPRFHSAVEVMLRLSDLNGREGGILPLRTGAVALVYLNALRIWLNDHSDDMAKTMAELDRGLNRLEKTLHFIPAPLRQFI